jgi:hypothetical protein
MQTIQGKIKQLREQMSKLSGELEILEKAQELLDSREPANVPKKRMGRPKGLKNKVATKKRRSRNAAEKTGVKGTRGRSKKTTGAEAPAES